MRREYLRFSSEIWFSIWNAPQYLGYNFYVLGLSYSLRLLLITKQSPKLQICDPNFLNFVTYHLFTSFQYLLRENLLESWMQKLWHCSVIRRYFFYWNSPIAYSVVQIEICAQSSSVDRRTKRSFKLYEEIITIIFSVTGTNLVWSCSAIDSYWWKLGNPKLVE